MKLPFKILGVDHIGIAPKNPGDLCNFFEKGLGIPFLGEELVSSQSTKTSFFKTEEDTTKLEILKAHENCGPIEAFLQKKGGGIHHIALRVDNLEAALFHLNSLGIRLIDKSPRKGAHGSKIAFIHPHSCSGILVELVQTAS